MTDSHPSLGPRCPGRPAIASCTSVPRLTATSATLGKADFELRQYRHRDRRRDSPRRRVALLFQCSFPLGIPSSQSVKLSKNSRRSQSDLSTPLRKLRGTSASRSCRRKETLKKLHYWATDSTQRPQRYSPSRHDTRGPILKLPPSVIYSVASYKNRRDRTPQKSPSSIFPDKAH